ncbi:MAG: endo-1,4-beta-xylanase [Planctomycetota bacterium]
MERPAGGQELIGGGWAKNATPQVGDGVQVHTEFSRVAASGMSFDRAVRVVVDKRPAKTWDVQINHDNRQAVKEGDVLHVRFWARCVESMTGEGFADVKFELGREPWTQSLHHQISYTNRWTRFDFPFRAGQDFAVGEAKMSFQFGYDGQTVEIGGVSVMNYGPDADMAALPQTKLVYPGHAADAPWRAAAAQRIDELRKGDLHITVVDAQGRPVPGAEVRIEMTRHAFSFGSAVVAKTLADPSFDPRYRETVATWFNEVVFENDLKWVNHGTGDPDDIAASLSWLAARDIGVRGHVLVWPGWEWLPEDLPALASNPEELRRRVEQRVFDAAGKYRGQIKDWDVINEPYNNHDLMDILGKEVMIDWFKLAQQADPEAKRYINDWGILTGGGNDTNHQDNYHDWIDFLVENGAPIDGIGLQGHFGSALTPPDRLLEILDRFAGFGKRIKITELDIVMSDEALRADYMRDFMTVMFSHEAVDGVLMWGFWAGHHWKPEAAPFDHDWTLKPHGQAWKDLVLGEWWTQETTTTGAQGQAHLRGFAGNYCVTVTHNGQTVTAKPSLTREGLTLKLVLDEPE